MDRRLARHALLPLSRRRQGDQERRAAHRPRVAAGAVRLPGRVRRHVRPRQAHPGHRQHPGADPPEVVEVRAAVAVQGRRLLREHAAVHRQQVGHRQPGDDARHRSRRRPRPRLRHLRLPHRRYQALPQGGRRLRPQLPSRRVRRDDALADRQRLRRRALARRRSRSSTSPAATPSSARRCCR